MVVTRNEWVRGQRWVSDSEPELGLGIILSGQAGRVEIVFPAVGEQRCYALESAPLRRVKFLPGDRITTHAGVECVVEQVTEEAGLLVYRTSQGDVAEAELSDSISFSKPEERLFGGKLDDIGAFELRGEALQRRAEMRASPIRGLVGARMDLIPHQLFIADEVSQRLLPRVLLADEVGLGKTIEACLILHRLILTGRASRVLILVPEALVHQWFVELLRRFQLSFALFDEERCQAIEEGDSEANPFLDSQWVITSVDFLAGNSKRAEQVLSAGWDVLVVDEAHHLEWSPEEESPAYEVVKNLSAAVDGLLLLTATPEQLGPDGHFARLKLLDPARHSNLEQYRLESGHYEAVADGVEALIKGQLPDKGLCERILGNESLKNLLRGVEKGDEDSRTELSDRLLDGFGLGRVMFRNTRARLGGFPVREPHLIKLKGKEPVPAKLKWLGDFVGKQEPSEKVLVICRTRELAEEIALALKDATGIETVVFHEDLTLLQRDRNAAFFAEEEGARVLVCSEIGSEGRNFQFARKLVLFDLPHDVDLLEQRIGRLDRIGQRGTIHIHVPFIEGAEEAFVRWCHEGLNAFQSTPSAAREVQREMAGELSAAMRGTKKALNELISRTRARCEEISSRFARGQDRLLEWSSHSKEKSENLVNQIRRWDTDAVFEDFAIRLFEHCGLHVEDLGKRRYFFLPGHLKSDAFPALPAEGITVTFDRQRALEREHESFLTWDHPMVRAALDLLLGSEDGNATFALWETKGEKRMLMEAWVVVECVAPAWIHAERFLPQTPIRLVVDHSGKDITEESTFQDVPMRRADSSNLLRNETVKRKVLPGMLEKIRILGAERSKPVIAAALHQMDQEVGRELTRLRALAAVNDHVRPEEIERLESLRTALLQSISAARVRIDAIKVIWKAPAQRSAGTAR